MAMNPNVAFPTRTTAPSASYPYGGAQNVSAPDDGTGTPWIASLINDVFGFQQALLSEAGIVPTNSPDEVGTSQYLDALNAIYLRLDGLASMTGTLKSDLTEGLVIHMDNFAVDVTNDEVIIGMYEVGAMRSFFGISGGDEIIIRAHNDTPNENAEIYMEDAETQIKHGSDSVVLRTVAATSGSVHVKNTVTGAGEERVLTESDATVRPAFINSDSVSQYVFTAADHGKSFFVTGSGAFNFGLSDTLPVGFWVNVTNHSTNTIGTLFSGSNTMRVPAGGSGSFPVDGYGTYALYDDASTTAWWQLWGLTE